MTKTTPEALNQPQLIAAVAISHAPVTFALELQEAPPKPLSVSKSKSEPEGLDAVADVAAYEDTLLPAWDDNGYKDVASSATTIHNVGRMTTSRSCGENQAGNRVDGSQIIRESLLELDEK